MSKSILVFAGTTEGRQLSEWLAGHKINHIMCVATEYGEVVLSKNDYASVHMGRLDIEGMKELMSRHELSFVVDATHPFAKEVTKNIHAAADALYIPYLRLARDTGADVLYDKIHRFSTMEACGQALHNQRGNILLTTGSKDIRIFESLKSRLFVRVLPSKESIDKCIEAGIEPARIIAMQGPFSTGLNEALIKEYDISAMVSKESGTTGGINEKIQAAKNLGIDVYLISNTGDEGKTSKEIMAIIAREYGIDLCHKILLAGIGPGADSFRTKALNDAIEQADYVLGASRMVSDIKGKPTLNIYSAKDIISFLKGLETKACQIVVLFSGDTGFYSGAISAYKAIMAKVSCGELKASVNILPGISSVSYFASKLGISYDDAHIMSVHGKDEAYSQLVASALKNKKTISIMSDKNQVNKLVADLSKTEARNAIMHVGINLSYEDERIVTSTVSQMNVFGTDGLYICMIVNEGALDIRGEGQANVCLPGLKDSSFTRDRVPMTKEEIRMISICKLQVSAGAVVYDIGCGTGSVACEIARLSDSIRVYGIDKNPEAVRLSDVNKERLGLKNLTIIEGMAPEGLKGLPKASHAFIGGSSGNMDRILDYLYDVNKSMRVVINGITVETIAAIQNCIAVRNVTDVSLVQLNVSRVRELGSYHLMEAENPVWVCSFSFGG